MNSAVHKLAGHQKIGSKSSILIEKYQHNFNSFLLDIDAEIWKDLTVVMTTRFRFDGPFVSCILTSETDMHCPVKVNRSQLIIWGLYFNQNSFSYIWVSNYMTSFLSGSSSSKRKVFCYSTGSNVFLLMVKEWFQWACQIPRNSDIFKMKSDWTNLYQIF